MRILNACIHIHVYSIVYIYIQSILESRLYMHSSFLSYTESKRVCGFFMAERESARARARVCGCFLARMRVGHVRVSVRRLMCAQTNTTHHMHVCLCAGLCAHTHKHNTLQEITCFFAYKRTCKHTLTNTYTNTQHAYNHTSVDGFGPSIFGRARGSQPGQRASVRG